MDAKGLSPSPTNQYPQLTRGVLPSESHLALLVTKVLMSNARYACWLVDWFRVPGVRLGVTVWRHRNIQTNP